MHAVVEAGFLICAVLYWLIILKQPCKASNIFLRTQMATHSAYDNKSQFVTNMLKLCECLTKSCYEVDVTGGSTCRRQHGPCCAQRNGSHAQGPLQAQGPRSDDAVRGAPRATEARSPSRRKGVEHTQGSPRTRHLGQAFFAWCYVTPPRSKSRMTSPSRP